MTPTHSGFRHETAFYATDDDFLEVVVPFVDEATAGGEPAIAAFGAVNENLLRDAVRHPERITFLPGATHYARPTDAILNYRRLLSEHVAGGAARIRVVGEIPHPGVGAPWDWWARYEVAVDSVYGEFPMWAMCAYDLRTTPAAVVDDVLRTHPEVVERAGRRPNPDFGTRVAHPDPHPAESTPPLIDLVDPTPAVARHAVGAIAADLDGTRRDDIVYAVSEAVTNGMCHGVPPVVVRAWRWAGGVVATVSDRGEGPTSPTAGLVPEAHTSTAGLGLWLTHRTCAEVTLRRAAHGYTIMFAV
ncbi:anti-sigma factor RsbA family regulatory protein [Actinosynnema sp. NPDC020468]|uniref:anti-sigma factor RsbA family regulatory protein n=1 Tax=Actinosynnema sp. NPDC020468 TaxID=3154488 RepID=UPI00340129C3